MPWRTGMVGLGWVSRRVWLPLLDADPRFQVVAAADVDASRAAPGRAFTTDWRELLDVHLDVAVVAVPNHLHVPVAAAFLAAGVNAVVEKPLCLDAGELQVLERAAQGGGMLLATHAARHRADVAALAALHRSGELGACRLLTASWVRASGVPGGWFTDRARAGGGAAFDLGWHLADVALWLLGRPTLCSTTGVALRGVSGSVASWSRRDGTGLGGDGDVEDDAVGLSVCDDGCAVLLRAAWRSHAACDRTTLELHGCEASATLVTTFGFSPQRVSSPSLVVQRDGTTRNVPLAREPVGVEYARQLDEIDAALRGTLPAEPVSAHLATLAMVRAMTDGPVGRVPA